MPSRMTANAQNYFLHTYFAKCLWPKALKLSCFRLENTIYVNKTYFAFFGIFYFQNTSLVNLYETGLYVDFNPENKRKVYNESIYKNIIEVREYIQGYS